MLKLWGRTNSNNVKKVLWCLDEIEQPYQRIEAGGVHGVVDTPEFRKMNPNGLVPVLQDDDLVLWESNAIVRYLAATRSAGLLEPSDPGVRARADAWMDWASTTFAPAFVPTFLTLVRTPPDKRDLSIVKAGQEKTATLMAMVDAALARAPYLSGAEFGMGDIPIGVLAYLWLNLPIERPSLPRVEDWYRRLTERPAYRTAVMIPIT